MPLSLGLYYNSFTLVTNYILYYARVFVTFSQFHPTIIFAGRVGATPPLLANPIYLTMMEVTNFGKYSSFLECLIDNPC